MRTTSCTGCGEHLGRPSYRIGRRPYCGGCFDAVIEREYTAAMVCRRCGVKPDSAARHTAEHWKA